MEGQLILNGDSLQPPYRYGDDLIVKSWQCKIEDNNVIIDFKDFVNALESMRGSERGSLEIREVRSMQ